MRAGCDLDLAWGGSGGGCDGGRVTGAVSLDDDDGGRRIRFSSQYRRFLARFFRAG